jgi:hypothetical protein
VKEKILPILITLFSFLILINLVILDLNWFRQQKNVNNSTSLTGNKENILPTTSPTLSEEKITNDNCGSICQKTIDQRLAQLSATLSAKQTATPIKTIEKVTTNQPSSLPQTIYIPLGGGGTTTSRDWADVGNAAIYFDLKDYSNFSEAHFEVFIKVLNGNGKVFARLYDATNSIGVQGSDVEANGENFTLVSSDKLNFWQGKNLYRIQIKSLNGYQAAVDSGRIKLILK